MWNMKMTIIPIIIGAPDTVTKELIQGVEGLEISGRVEAIQTTASLRSASILRGVLIMIIIPYIRGMIDRIYFPSERG